MQNLANRLRALAVQRDNAGHAMREIAFHLWCRSTVFPQAVDRWIREIGSRA